MPDESPPHDIEPLTDRENSILTLIAQGLTDQEISACLVLSHNTVKWYIRRIFSKLGVKRRTQAVVVGRTLGLLEQSSEAREPGNRSRLPVPSTPLIGRERTQVEIARLLDEQTTRLVTLLGPGGIGKTRVALALAAQRQQLDPEVYFISLERISTEDQLVEAIAEAVGLHLERAINIKDSLLLSLYKRRVLLVLDNFEHLLDAAPFVASMINTSANIQIITTSREPLDLSGETLYEITGLRYLAGTSDDDWPSAVQLFLQCARRAQHDYAPDSSELESISQICQLVDGMPLAIEIAAAWISTLSANEIFDVLKHNVQLLKAPRRDVPARHRSIWGIFDHTWSQLTADERDGLSRVSIFEAPFNQQAAQQAAGVSVGVLHTLLHKSLLHRVGHRYRIHALVKVYAEEKLREDSHARITVMEEHSHYYSTLLNDLTPMLKSRRQIEASSIIGEEYSDIVAGWKTALDSQDWLTTGMFLDGLYLYHDLKGMFQKGSDLFEELVQRLEAASDLEASEQIILGKAKAYSGRLATRMGNHEQASERLQQGLLILEAHQARQESGFALKSLGYIRYLTGDYEEAISLIEESLRIRRDLGDASDIADSLNALGIVAEAQLKYESAWTFYQQALEIQQAIHDTRGVALSYNNIGDLARTLGQYEEAKDYLKRSSDSFLALGDRWGASLAINNLGVVAFIQGEDERAQSLIEDSLRLRREIGHTRGVVVCLHGLGNLAATKGDYEKARVYLTESFRLGVRIKMNVRDLMLIVEHLAEAISASADEPVLVAELNQLIRTESSYTDETLHQILELL